MFGKKETENKQPKKKLETSKLVLWIVFIICIEILIYTQVVVLILRDSNALYTLVGVPVTLVPIILGYYWKARSQNIKGGITYDTAMKQLEIEQINYMEDVTSSALCESDVSLDNVKFDVDNTINDIGGEG